jgi:two-component system sensor histidine kinase KdpD
VSHAVSQSLDLQRIIDSALERIAVAMDVKAGCVHLIDDSRLVLEGYYGFTPQCAVAMKLAGDDDGIVGKVFKLAQPVVVNDLAACGETNLASLVKQGYRAFAGVPLVIMGETIGVVGIATGLERRFTHSEVELLTAIGREISIAVRNAQLHEEASSARALRELDAFRTEFLADVSHELRTPLATIKGFASSLLQPDVEFDEERRREFLQTIDREADGLNRLIEELLLMSRVEAGALEVKVEWVGVAKILDSIKERLDNLATRHRLRIKVPSNLPQAAVDGEHIGEVLTNLVENAVKYSDEGTQITIDAHHDGTQVIISVTDEGLGIPSEFHEKVFKRFCVVDDAVTRHRRGTGLGLSICRGIVEAHGGRIWVESEPGKGSMFSFSLPAEQGD